MTQPLAVVISAAVAFFAVSYLLGSINAAVIISKLVYHQDIRNYGSGNAGMTNILRTYGAKAAVATFIIDLVKGVIAVLIPMVIANIFVPGDDLVSQIWKLAGAAGVIIGHNFPVFFQFKGGKGVLTSFGVILTLAPIPALIAFGCFIIIILITNYVSLASMLGGFICSFIVFFFGDKLGSVSGFTPIFVACIFISILLVIRHHANIGRLIRGEESKMFMTKKRKAKYEAEKAAKAAAKAAAASDSDINSSKQ